MNEFMKFAKKIYPRLKQEDIHLNFQGYTETWREYIQMDDSVLVDKFTLATECFFWAEYFGDLLIIIQHLARREKSREKYYRSFYELTPPNHSKFPKIKTDYDDVKKFRQELELFSRHLKNQRYAFMQAHRSLMRSFGMSWQEFKTQEYMHMYDEEEKGVEEPS